MKNILTAPGSMGVSIAPNFINTGTAVNTSLRDFYSNQSKEKEQSKIFKGLTVDEEKEILDICDSQDIPLQSKNILCNELYAKKLKENKTKQYFEDKSAATRDLTKASVDSKDKKYSNQCDELCKISYLANGVRQYIMNNNPDVDPVDLTKLQDKDIAADFVKDNPQYAVIVNDYLDKNYQGTTEEFLNKVGLPVEDVSSSYEKYKTELPVNSKGSIYHEVTSLGREGDEWNDKLADFIHLDTTPLAEANNKLGTFVANTFKSVWNIGADAVGMVLNPIDTANGMIDLAGGVGVLAGFAAEQAFKGGDFSEKSLDEYIKYNYPEGSAMRYFWKPEEGVEAAKLMGDYFKQRYGSVEGLKNTLYQDPAGLIQDVADVFKGGTKVAKKALKGSRIVNTMEQISNGLNKVNASRDYVQNKALQGVSKVGDVLTDTSLEDIKNIPANTKKTIKNYAEEKKSSMKEFGGQLTDEEKKIVQSNPYAGEFTQNLITEYKKRGDTTSITKLVDEARQKYIKDELVPQLEKVIGNVREEGTAYNMLDKSGITLNGKGFKDIFENTLKDNDISINDGKIDFTKQHTVKGNSTAFEDLYKELEEIGNRSDDMTVKEYRSLRESIRQTMREIGYKDAGKTQLNETGKLLNNILDNINKEAHNQNAILAGIDEIYSKNVNKAKELKKGLVDKEGKIKPEALASKTKQTTKSSGMSAAEQLEELSPGHKLKAEGIDIAGNLLRKMARGDKEIGTIGAVGRGVGHAAGLITGGGIGGIAGGYIGEILGKKLGKTLLKKRDIDWGEALSSLNEEGLKAIENVTKKIDEGGAISKADEAKIKSLVNQIPDAKASQEFLKEIKALDKKKSNQRKISNALKEATSYGVKS